MPKVGAKEFPYTREGIAEAKATAHATGHKLGGRRSYRDVARLQSKKHKGKKPDVLTPGDTVDLRKGK